MYPDLSKKLHPKYDRQIIFVLMSDRGLQTDGIKFGEEVHEKSTQHYEFRDGSKIVPIILSANNVVVISDDLIRAFQSVDSRTRIYIRGHCSAGSEYLQTMCKEYTLSHYNLSQIFARYIPRTSDIFNPNPEIRSLLKISLSGCSAGLPSQMDTPASHINNSFAARLLHSLSWYGIYCVIAARLGTVTVNKFLEDRLRFNVINSSHEVYDAAHEKYDQLAQRLYFEDPLILEQQKILASMYYPVHDKNAKALYYCNEQGKQCMIPAYGDKEVEETDLATGLRQPRSSKSAWCRQAIVVINQCIKPNTPPSKKIGLNRLIEFIRHSKTDDEVRNEIETELKSPSPGKYHVNAHSNPAKALFGSKTNTHIKLAQLIKWFPF